MKKSHLGKSTARIKLKVESAEVLRNQSFAMAQREMKSIFRSGITDSVDHVTSSCHELHERADVTLGLKTSISPPYMEPQKVGDRGDVLVLSPRVTSARCVPRGA
jgi:hypothetical protein